MASPVIAPFPACARVTRSALLGSLALAVTGTPASALVIDPIFESSWSSAPAGATTDVNNVINQFEQDFSNPVTITVQFGWGDIANSISLPTNTLGATTFPSTAPQYDLSATQNLYANAVSMQPNNTALATAAAHLPSTYSNGSQSTGFFVTDAQYLALNGTAQNADAINAYVGFGARSNWDFSGGSPGAANFDFTSVVQHEIAHAMGRVDYAFTAGTGGNPPFLTPLDFFKYNCNSTTLNPTFSATCFSINGGTTDLSGRQFDNSSDSSDWLNNNNDAFDAFASSGEFPLLTSVDLTLLDALGWDPAQVRVPEPATFGLLGVSLFGLGWLRRRRRA